MTRREFILDLQNRLGIDMDSPNAKATLEVVPCECPPDCGCPGWTLKIKECV